MKTFGNNLNNLLHIPLNVFINPDRRFIRRIIKYYFVFT